MDLKKDYESSLIRMLVLTNGYCNQKTAWERAERITELEVGECLKFRRSKKNVISLYNSAEKQLGYLRDAMSKRICPLLDKGINVYIKVHGAVPDEPIISIDQCYVEISADGVVWGDEPVILSNFSTVNNEGCTE